MRPAGPNEGIALGQITAIYVRVSSGRQPTTGQQADLKRWAEGHKDEPLKWFRDRFTGKPTERPAFDKLLADVEAGKVGRIIVWRVDRLGLTAKGLTDLFKDLLARGVGLVSLKEGLDLATPSGRRMADVLASVAAFESEARAERILAGQAAARAAGKRWGGSPKGRRLKVTADQEAVIRRMKEEGDGVSAIARATGLSRPTIYRVLQWNEDTSASGTGPKSRRKPRSRPRG
jgi:DNA invertase Pin-like site-specific DNA recombinase